MSEPVESAEKFLLDLLCGVDENGNGYSDAATKIRARDAQIRRLALEEADVPRLVAEVERLRDLVGALVGAGEGMRYMVDIRGLPADRIISEARAYLDAVKEPS